MEWNEVLLVLLVCHCTGDFLLQTEFQATQKFGGLGRDRVRRHALCCHVATYAIPFVPALAWIADEVGAGRAAAVAAVVLLTHLVQDDGRLLARYVRRVKHTEASFGSPLWVTIDQSAHLLFLFGAGLLAGA